MKCNKCKHKPKCNIKYTLKLHEYPNYILEKTICPYFKKEPPSPRLSEENL